MGIAAALLIGAMLLGSPPKPTRLRAIEVRGVAISEGLELGRPGFAGTEGCAGSPEVGIRQPQTSPPLAPPGPPPTTKVLEALRADAAGGDKVLRWFEVEVRTAGGEVAEHVRKQVYVRLKPRARPAGQMA